MILVNQYVEFLIDNNLTQDQYLLLTLLHQNKLDLIQKYKKAFPNIEGSMISKLAIKDLIHRKFIIPSGKNNYKIGIKFLEIFVTPEKAVDEIYDIYPAFLDNKGVSIPLTSMDKRIFKEIYIPKIMGNIKEHNKVLKDIQYGIDNNLITIGINKFLTSEQWKVFRKLRIQDQTTTNTELTDDF